ncbi:Rho guanine nucleotide exchange factor, putative [Hondaea fermentalgiana]|uniref:Rho guanine nucleotide exchange factor, putative n=1 Tax=Hondaea fermentalgiana TaxID=2315210 RepID=A0A2R5G7Z0_9STRA|nr:Rho guanine nucleotide exchange factor, putative [Hondaea fermentalgiana]|eukprot:GBG24603.1 Rho guanine nucleotide exchange factor, putative [Hondaea fermentalgiana]
MEQELTWAAKVYVCLGVTLTLAVIVAAWYLVWELILKQIKFLRRFLDQQQTGSASASPPAGPRWYYALWTPIVARDTDVHKAKVLFHRVVRELYATEGSYLESLKTLSRAYVNPLRLNARGISPIASLNEVNALFSDVEAVLRISERVFGDMTSFLESGTLDDKVGQVFCDLAPLLKLYTAYVNSHHRALATHQMLLERPAYQEFCRERQESEECAGCSLDSYLIMPVQRVPRYELLLKELLKQTKVSHPEYTEITTALRKVSNVATMINNNLRDHERRGAVLAVQNKFGSSIQLVSPQRWLIREALLRKVCKRKTKNFLFVLFNDVLIYGSQSYRHHRTIELCTAEASACEATAQGEPQFQVLSPSKSFKVVVSSEQERDAWVRDLQQSIAEAQRAHQTRSGPPLIASASLSSMPLLSSTMSMASMTSSFSRSKTSRRASYAGPGIERKGSGLSLADMAQFEHAPVRSSGSNVGSCSLCAIEFTYLKRRHQCRRCGIIVCDKCSPHRWRLRNLSQHKLKRVCQRCFSQLVERVPSFQSDVSAGDEGPCTNLPRHGSVPPLGFAGLGANSFRESTVSREPSELDLSHLALPEGWCEAADPDGDIYFWNVDTMETTWTRPMLEGPPPLPPKLKNSSRRKSSRAQLTRKSSASREVDEDKCLALTGDTGDTGGPYVATSSRCTSPGKLQTTTIGASATIYYQEKNVRDSS